MSEEPYATFLRDRENISLIIAFSRVLNAFMPMPMGLISGLRYGERADEDYVMVPVKGFRREMYVK